MELRTGGRVSDAGGGWCGGAPTDAQGRRFIYRWWGDCHTNLRFCHTNFRFAPPTFSRFEGAWASKFIYSSSAFHYGSFETARTMANAGNMGGTHILYRGDCNSLQTAPFCPTNFARKAPPMTMLFGCVATKSTHASV